MGDQGLRIHFQPASLEEVDHKSWGDRQTDRQTDGRTDGRTDRQTDGRTDSLPGHQAGGRGLRIHFPLASPVEVDHKGRQEPAQISLLDQLLNLQAATTGNLNDRKYYLKILLN